MLIDERRNIVRERQEARELRVEQAGMCFGGDGGSSSSSTSTSTTTQNVDKRQVVDTGSVGVSSDQSTVNVTTSDYGAVKASFDLAKTSSQNTLDTLNKAVGFATDALKLANEGAKNLEAGYANVGTAYQTAQDSATGLRFVVGIGAVVAGIIALIMLPKLKGSH